MTVEAEYLGCRLKFPEDEPPAIAKPALSDEEKIDDLFEGKAVGGRMPLFAEVDLPGSLHTILQILEVNIFPSFVFKLKPLG